jgi:hypothetical protein
MKYGSELQVKSLCNESLVDWLSYPKLRFSVDGGICKITLKKMLMFLGKKVKL